MKRLKHFKFKIYKRFQSEIWGNIILVGKKNNTFRMILKNFRYLRYLFMIKRKRNYPDSYYINRIRIKKQLFFIKQKSNTPSNHKNNIFYNSFWLKFTNFYKKLDLQNLLVKTYENNHYTKDKTLNNYFSWLYYLNWRSYKFRSKFFFKFKFFRKFFKKKHIYNNNIFSYITTDYIFKKKSYYVKKKLPFWIEMKLEKEKLSLFFGLINKRKYIRAQNVVLNNSKIRSEAIFYLIGQLTFFLFSLNLHMNMYFIRNIIRSKHILINNKIRNNPFYCVKLMDNINIIKNKLLFYYNSIKMRFKSKLILFNTPDYVEINYKIMAIAVWKVPLLENILGPYDYPFETLSFDWLQYNKGNLLPRKRIYK